MQFIRIIIYLLLFYLCYRALRSWLLRNFGQPAQRAEQAPEQVDDLMVKDPQCGIYFPKREGVRSGIRGEDYFFCSQKCRDEYLERRHHEE